jgi:hypothetical protein
MDIDDQKNRILEYQNISFVTMTLYTLIANKKSIKKILLINYYLRPKYIISDNFIN